MEVSLGVIERRFAELIWQNEPISSSALAKRSLAELNWKKSTSFTVLKRLCEKGLFQNEGGTVTSLLSREEFDTLQSRQFVADRFDGSLPAFLAAFTSGKALSKKELDEVRKLLDQFEEA